MLLAVTERDGDRKQRTGAITAPAGAEADRLLERGVIVAERGALVVNVQVAVAEAAWRLIQYWDTGARLLLCLRL